MAGRHNATGRSTGGMTARDRKIHGPPKGSPWVWLPTELLNHLAWRSLSLNARKIIDFLLIEHRHHGGRENGNLAAPYNQLERFGVSRRLIRASFLELEAAGLVRMTRQGGKYAGGRETSTYRLTFYAAHDNVSPTSEWRRSDGAKVKAARKDAAENKSRASENRRGRRANPDLECTMVNLESAPS